MNKNKIQIIALATVLMLPAFVFAEGIRHTTRTATSTSDREITQEMKERQEEFKNKINEMREQTKQRIEQEREALKDKLKKIKDQRKQKIVERIDQNLTALNARLMNHFTNVLKQLESVLTRISSRADKAEANGNDVSKVRAAIEAAKDKIQKARDAIAAQIGKVYEIPITDDTHLKRDVGSARQSLHADIKKVWDAVKAARDAVHDAATTLAKIPKIDESGNPATPTSTSSSTNTSTEH